MNIRSATIEDAGAVCEYLREFRAEGLTTVMRHEGIPTHEEEAAMISKLDGIAGVMFLALDSGRALGCLTAEIKAHPQFHHSCEFGIGVLREARGSGVGSALIDALTAWARQRNLRRIELSVFARNQGAIRLFQRLGYCQEGTRKGAVRIGDAYEDVVEMSRLL